MREELDQLTYNDLIYTIEVIKEAIKITGRSPILEEYLRECRRNREKRLRPKQTLVTGDYMSHITKQIISAEEKVTRTKSDQCFRYKYFTKPNGDVVIYRFFEKDED